MFLLQTICNYTNENILKVLSSSSIELNLSSRRRLLETAMSGYSRKKNYLQSDSTNIDFPEFTTTRRSYKKAHKSSRTAFTSSDLPSVFRTTNRKVDINCEKRSVNILRISSNKLCLSSKLDGYKFRS